MNMNTQKQQTFTSFFDKWSKNKTLAFSETLKEGSDIFNWIINRNGFSNSKELSNFLSTKNKILDAGCGNGRVTALLHNYAHKNASLTGIDLTAADVAKDNLKHLERIQIFEKDLLTDLSDLGKFDFIYCQEVLHHTSNPKAAFLNLTKNLEINGEIAIYVYKLKAPIREFADDLIRHRISDLPYEKAMDQMREITEFGKILSELNLKVTLPKVDVIGIEAGEYDVQRIFYHHFFKCFWNPELSYDENVAINYDWYHPQLCTRHTIEEILGWFADADLTVVHQLVDHYGITVRGVKIS
jgi:SAM-dependent methyltransferase